MAQPVYLQHQVPYFWPRTFQMSGVLLPRKPTMYPTRPLNIMHLILKESKMNLPRKFARTFWKALHLLRMGFLKAWRHCRVTIDALCTEVSHFLAVNRQALDSPLEMACQSQSFRKGPPFGSVVEPTGAPSEPALLEGGLWAELEVVVEKEFSDRLEWDFPEDGLDHSSGTLMEKSSSCLETVSNYSSLSSNGELDEETDSGWSEDEEEEEEEAWDEGSDVNSDLWESFLCSDDPYNPFNFSSSTGRREKVTETVRCPESLSQIDEEEEEEEEEEEDDIVTGRVLQHVHGSQDQKKGSKKVRFNDTVKVRPLVVWRFASRAARDGSCWQEMARDRDRFRRRIQAASDVISPILQPQHRARALGRIQSW